MINSKFKKVVATTLMSISLVASTLQASASVYAQDGLRPIAVMMPTDKAAQPQYGIGSADVLYEIMEEGGISRQMAIINNWQGLQKIGNIRSCRNYYTSASREWDAILVHFGGVAYMKGSIDAPDMNNISGTYEYGIGGAAPGAGQFFRSNDKKAPHNAYISAAGITAACNQNGYQLTTRPQYGQRHFNIGATDNTLTQYADALTANNVDLSKIFEYTKSSFIYNPATGTYAKNLHGAAQVDALTGQQLQFSNIVIQFTNYQVLDQKGYLNFNMLGTGQGYYITKGKAIPITWSKGSDYAPTSYKDALGNEVQFNNGKTYIGIAQAGTTLIVN